MARVALVTGGTRGIGAAISTTLRDAGISVAANYAGNDEAARAFTAETGIPAYKFDVSDFDGVHAAVAKITEEIGPIDIVGPVCESGDTFAKQRDLPLMQAGDLVAFRSAGAYGAVMASEYNARPMVPEVIVNQDQFAVIRPRPTYAEMIGRDRLPPWLEGKTA